jgi:putative DNA primase/helicase
VVYAVPRHDLRAEQVTAFATLGLRAMLWKGRTAPDPSADNPDQLMCLDSEANPADTGWWYPMAERRLRLVGDRTAPLTMEAHSDPIAEAVRWSICEGELIQAMGRAQTTK